MISNVQVTRILNENVGGAKEAIEKMKLVKVNQVKSLITKTGENLIDSITALVSDIDIIYEAQTVDAIGLPKHITKVIYKDGVDSDFTLSIRSKLKAKTKYRVDTNIKVNENIIDSISKAFEEVLTDMFLIEVANENIEDLNAKIASLCNDYHVPFKFSFTVNPEENAPYIDKITDDEVVFTADIIAAKSISELGIFQGGDSYNELLCKESTDELMSALVAIQTTPQLLKAKIGLIKTITKVITKKHSNKIIRGRYHRNVKYLDKVKSGDAYFTKKVMIDNEEIEIFSLVHKDEDGTLSVILKPFNTSTLFNVDYDVLKDIAESEE